MEKIKNFIRSNKKRIAIISAGLVVIAGIVWSTFGQEYTAQIQKGDLLLSQGRYAEAAEAYPDYFIGPVPERVQNALLMVDSDKQYRNGMQCYNSGDYRQAYYYFANVTSEYPKYQNVQELKETSKNKAISKYLSEANDAYRMGLLNSAIERVETGLSAFQGNSELLAALEKYQVLRSEAKSNTGTGLYSTFQSKTTSEQNNEYTVYITKTGAKYHSSGCQYLRQSQIAISKEDAISEGYTPCSRCNP